MGIIRVIFSICITTFNEQDSIEVLVNSLIPQLNTIDEIIICDGGSTDGTIETIKYLQKKHKNIKLVVSPGKVAHGRNVSIKNAKGTIIATIDAGCVAKPNWLYDIRQPFHNRNVDIVSGFYEMKWKTPFQKIMALYRGTHPKRYDSKTFIPSCRSVAFKKSVWKELGGFNERLSLSGEDTDFFYRAIKSGKQIVQRPQALVEWSEPKQYTFKDFKKFYYYAKGDAQTGIWWDPSKKLRTHNIKIMTIFLRYILFIISLYIHPWIFLTMITAYTYWAIWKWRDIVLQFNERIWVPVVQFGTDVMVMIGFLSGLMTKKNI
jgi:glycosyltransferase involved in cell wall biosynthesis